MALQSNYKKMSRAEFLMFSRRVNLKQRSGTTLQSKMYPQIPPIRNNLQQQAVNCTMKELAGTRMDPSDKVMMWVSKSPFNLPRPWIALDEIRATADETLMIMRREVQAVEDAMGPININSIRLRFVADNYQDYVNGVFQLLEVRLPMNASKETLTAIKEEVETVRAEHPRTKHRGSRRHNKRQKTKK